MKNKPYKVAITVGCFDMLHEGHVNLFNAMQEQAENIYVLVHDDDSIYKNKNKLPVQEHGQRMKNVKRLSWLEGWDIYEHAVYYADPSSKLKDVVESIQYAFGLNNQTEKIVYMRGDDWQDFPGKEYIDSVGIDIKYVPYTKGVSSSKRREEL